MDGDGVSVVGIHCQPCFFHLFLLLDQLRICALFLNLPLLIVFKGFHGGQPIVSENLKLVDLRSGFWYCDFYSRGACSTSMKRLVAEFEKECKIGKRSR